MITLFGSLFGFFSAMVPELLRFVRDRDDRAHEIALLKLQLEQAASGRAERLDEIRLEQSASERIALYKTYHTGVEWVDALNGTVRPVLAYAFFLLYAIVKLWQFSMVDGALPWTLHSLWGQEDQAIFAGIISFYFGQRAFLKMRK